MRLRSIYTLFFAAALATVLFCGSALLASIDQATQRLAVSLQTANMARTSETIAVSLTMFLEGRLASVRDLATRPEITRAAAGKDPMAARALLADVLAASDGLWALVVFDAEGRVAAGQTAAGHDLAAMRVSDRAYYKALLSGEQTAISHVFRPKTGGMPVFSLAAAILPSVGAERGVGAGKPAFAGGVAAILDWQTFTDRFMAPLSRARLGEAFIVDKRLLAIAHTDPELLFADLSETPMGPVLARSLERDEPMGSFRLGQGRSGLTVFHAREPVSGWSVVMAADEADLLAGVATERNLLFVVAAAMLLILTVCLGLAAHWLALRPIRKLARAARELAAQADAAAANPAQPPPAPVAVPSVVTKLRPEFVPILMGYVSVAEAAALSASFARSVLAALPLPAAVTDEKDVVLYANQPLHDLFRPSGDSSVHQGRPLAALLFGSAGGATSTREAMESGSVVARERFYITQRGSKLLARTVAAPILAEPAASGGPKPRPVVKGAVLLVTPLPTSTQDGQIRDAASHVRLRAQDLDTEAAGLLARCGEIAARAGELRGRARGEAARGEERELSRVALDAKAEAALCAARTAAATAQEGGQALTDLARVMDRVVRETRDLTMGLEEARKKSAAVDDVASLTATLAEAAATLADNAYFAAAAAGEYGSGFTVVATDARELSERIIEADRDVATALTKAGKAVRENLDAAAQIAAFIESSAGRVHETGAAMGELSRDVEATAEAVQALLAAVDAEQEEAFTVAEAAAVLSEIAEAVHELSAQAAPPAERLRELAGELVATAQHLPGPARAGGGPEGADAPGENGGNGEPPVG